MLAVARSLRRAAAPASLLLVVTGCMGSEATGTVTDVFASGIVHGVVRGPTGAVAAGVHVQAALYPIDRSQLESGTCLGPLTTGPSTTTAADGSYRLQLDGFLGRPGVGCVRLVVSPNEAVDADDLTVDVQTVRYLLTRADSTRADIDLPARQ